MRIVFVDALYWIAIVNPNDQWYHLAIQARKSLGEKVILTTTDEVLTEFLNGLSKYGEYYRNQAVKMVREILCNPNVQVIPQSRDSFLKGIESYAQRLDKNYSLVDCISMNTMRSRSISEALTHDIHFEQEGYQRLITQPESGKLL